MCSDVIKFSDVHLKDGIRDILYMYNQCTSNEKILDFLSYPRLDNLDRIRISIPGFPGLVC